MYCNKPGFLVSAYRIRSDLCETGIYVNENRHSEKSPQKSGEPQAERTDSCKGGPAAAPVRGGRPSCSVLGVTAAMRGHPLALPHCLQLKDAAASAACSPSGRLLIYLLFLTCPNSKPGIGLSDPSRLS